MRGYLHKGCWVLLGLIAAGMQACAATPPGAACQGHRVELQVLGSGGPELDDRRASSAYLIRLDGRARLLVDAGPGSALNFERAGARLEDLDALVLTHLHVDHSADLPAIVKAGYFSARTRDLPVYGPAGNGFMPATTQFLQRLLGPEGAYPYLSEYVDPARRSDYHLRGVDVELDTQEVRRFTLTPAIKLSALAVHHGPVAALAWRVDVHGCSVTFSGDTSHRYGHLAELARGSDILLAHNAVPEGARGAARNLHMPPSQIGAIAEAAGVARLILSHRMQRTLGREGETLRHIREDYTGPVEFADDLDRFELGSAGRVE